MRERERDTTRAGRLHRSSHGRLGKASPRPPERCVRARARRGRLDTHLARAPHLNTNTVSTRHARMLYYSRLLLTVLSTYYTISGNGPKRSRGSSKILNSFPTTIGPRSEGCEPRPSSPVLPECSTRLRAIFLYLSVYLTCSRYDFLAVGVSVSPLFFLL